MIRVQLPLPLQTLAKTQAAVVMLDVAPPITQRRVLDALESHYPQLIGTTRDQLTQKRRAYIRFFADGEDYSDASPDDPLPANVAAGAAAFLIVGALSGG